MVVMARIVVVFPAPLSLLNILDDDGVIDAFQVHIHLFFGSIHGGNIRKAAVLQERGKQCFLVTCWLQLAILSERERKNGYLHISAGQQCCQFSREHIGVRAGNIQIDLLFDIQTVYNFLKLRHLLDLIQKDISGPVRTKPFCQVLIKFFVIQQFFIFQCFKIQRYDLIVAHSAGFQCFLELL